MKITAAMLAEFAALGLSPEQMAGVSAVMERADDERRGKERGSVATLIRNLVANGASVADIIDAVDSLGRPREPNIGRRLGWKAWAKIRAYVFARDGHVCAYCGNDVGPFECDHVIPLARGGSNDVSNLTVACRPCNNSKSDHLLSEWAR